MRVTEPKTQRLLDCGGGVTFDAVAGIVTRAEGSFALRPKSHRLLSYLIAHRDRPVSREELINEIWDGAAVSEATVTGCLKEIRQALGDDAREPLYIRTLAKKGYWWVAPLTDSPPLPGPFPWQRWAAIALPLVALVGVMIFYVARSGLPPAESRPWGEIAWWPLDEGSGLQVRERIRGGTATVPPGVLWTRGAGGSALSFEGRARGVTSVGDGMLPRGAEPRTLTAWVRTTGPRADTATLFQYGNRSATGSADAFALRFDQIGRAGFANGGEWFAPRRLDDGAWHFLAAVFEGGAGRRLRLYVDGVEGDQRPVPAHLEPSGPTHWSIGQPLWGGTPFRGEIDDVRVYGHALAARWVEALYACRTASPPLEIAGRSYFFIPVFKGGVEVGPGGVLTHAGLDVGGIAFVERGGDCALQQTRASNVGQDLLFEMEIKPGGRPDGPLTESGPFFRSRPAAAGDGIMGGTSAGYWIQLQSNGQVLVRRLHPIAVVAFSRPLPDFDAQGFHRFRVEARGETAQVTLDGRLVEFDHAGERLHRVPLPPTWETAAPPGLNRGAAGVAFSCTACRGQAGGQQVRGLRVTRL